MLLNVQFDKTKHPKSYKLLVVMLIILDTFRRMLFHEARPIDTAMLVVEIIILALILAEFIWKVLDWRVERQKTKQRELAINQSLNSLDDNSLLDDLIYFTGQATKWHDG